MNNIGIEIAIKIKRILVDKVNCQVFCDYNEMFDTLTVIFIHENDSPYFFQGIRYFRKIAQRNTR